MRTQEEVLELIREERISQDNKWGKGQRHSLFGWMTVLGEEYGEACQEALRVSYGGKDQKDLTAELVQVAAVVVAMLERVDG